MNKHPVIDDETIANNVSDTISKLRDSQSAGLMGKRFKYCFMLVFLILNIFILLDFDIFVKSQLFQYVVMVQVIINICVVMPLMIIHHRQQIIQYILLIQLNHELKKTIFYIFLLLSVNAIK